MSSTAFLAGSKNDYGPQQRQGCNHGPIVFGVWARRFDGKAHFRQKTWSKLIHYARNSMVLHSLCSLLDFPGANLISFSKDEHCYLVVVLFPLATNYLYLRMCFLFMACEASNSKFALTSLGKRHRFFAFPLSDLSLFSFNIHLSPENPNQTVL
jgi:hypothetical protein